MNRKLAFSVFVFFFLLLPLSVTAEEVKENRHIALVYTNEAGLPSIQVKKLQALVKHFSGKVTLLSDEDLTFSSLEDVDLLIYYGESQRSLPLKTIKSINQWEGGILGIGYNTSQFRQFSHVTESEVEPIRTVIDQRLKRKVIHLQSPLFINVLKGVPAEEVFIYGKFGSREDFPLLIQKDNNFLFNAIQIEAEMKYLLADILHDFIPNGHKDHHEAYLRIDGIHPLSDPKDLEEIAEILLEKELPFQLGITPVYIDSDSEEVTYLSDSPKLLEKLRDLQNKGVSIIAKGYHGQYDAEAEGFEFWDAPRNQIIIGPSFNDERETLLQRTDFVSEELYEEYMMPFYEAEAALVAEKLEKSIHEFVSNELLPVAFTVPKDSMSEQGYKITSTYFSTILGRIQLSDQDRIEQVMLPYETSLDTLGEMLLVPETLGSIDLTEDRLFLSNQKKLEQLLLVRDSVISGLYPLSLGGEFLEEFLSLYEKVPKLSWIDLKNKSYFVKTDKVSITQASDGSLLVKSDLTWFDQLREKIHFSFFEKILWFVTAVVLIFILLFILFIFSLRARLKKRLFMERKSNG